MFNDKIYKLESYDRGQKINDYINIDYIKHNQRSQLDDTLNYKRV